MTSDDKRVTEQFLNTRLKEIPTSDPQVAKYPVDTALRSSSFALLAGAAGYGLLPELIGTEQRDEVVGLSAAVAGAFFGGVQGVQRLCDSLPEKEAEEILDVVKGSGGGVLFGSGFNGANRGSPLESDRWWPTTRQHFSWWRFYRASKLSKGGQVLQKT